MSKALNILQTKSVQTILFLAIYTSTHFTSAEPEVSKGLKTYEGPQKSL